MKITSFNSLGCYDLIVIVNLPIAQTKKILTDHRMVIDDNLLVWENEGHKIEDSPDRLGTLIRLSVSKSRTLAFAHAITDIAIAEDNFDPEGTE
jgi:hypothetical protein